MMTQELAGLAYDDAVGNLWFRAVAALAMRAPYQSPRLGAVSSRGNAGGPRQERALTRPSKSRLYMRAAAAVRSAMKCGPRTEPDIFAAQRDGRLVAPPYFTK
jgi:hypothetical protein